MAEHHSPNCSRGRNLDGSPNPVDINVGKRVRLRRLLLGFSQEELAAKLGLTFQQIQKYERGSNRISGSRLYDMSQILQVPVDYFFEGISQNRQTSATKTSQQDEEAITLVRAYQKIKGPKLRRLIYQLVISLGSPIASDYSDIKGSSCDTGK